jgi:hypothetical protein
MEQIFIYIIPTCIQREQSHSGQAQGTVPTDFFLRRRTHGMHIRMWSLGQASHATWPLDEPALDEPYVRA